MPQLPTLAGFKKARVNKSDLYEISLQSEGHMKNVPPNCEPREEVK